AVAILVAMLGGLMMPSERHGEFQRVIAVDEFNLVEEDERMMKAMVRVARLVRRRGATLGLMGEGLLDVSDAMFALAELCVVFKQRNPRVFEHLRDRVGALRGWHFNDVCDLDPAVALVAATTTTDPKWRVGARKVRFRPLLCMHGGMTRAMI